MPAARSANEAGPSAAGAHDAGARVVRGGILRTAGYGFGFALGIPTSVLLLRHLGVDGFARYATVVALLGIVSGITDAGLTAVGSRELALRPPGPERDRLLETILGLRLIVTPLGVLLAVAFAIVAGYPHALVLGTLVGGIGVVAVAVQSTLLMPLPVDLRFGRVTIVDVLRQVLALAGVAALVAIGAGLFPLLAVQAPIGIATMLVAFGLTWRRRHPAPPPAARARLDAAARVAAGRDLADARGDLPAAARAALRLPHDDHADRATSGRRSARSRCSGACPR